VPPDVTASLAIVLIPPRILAVDGSFASGEGGLVDGVDKFVADHYELLALATFLAQAGQEGNPF